MTHSTTDITCSSCNNKYHGVLDGVFNNSSEYAATCPDCSKQTFLINQTGIIDSQVPNGAVIILPVKKIN